MEAINLEKIICLRFCPYYKPGKDEELECFGFTIIERLINKGIIIPLKDLQYEPDHTTKEELIQSLCNFCPFSQNDCDFFAQKIDAKPCGGLIFLSRLIDNHRISINDIHHVI